MDKLVESSYAEECTENIDEVKIAKTTLARHENVCLCSCTIYDFLIAMIFKISIGIGAYFSYSHWYLKKCITRVKFVIHTQWNCIQRSCA